MDAPGPPLDCRSPEGETVGLVDAAVAVLRQVSLRLPRTARGLKARCPAEVEEALKDLYSDPAVMHVFTAARQVAFRRWNELTDKLGYGRPGLDKAERAEMRALEKWMLALPIGVPEDDEAMRIIRDAAKMVGDTA